MFCAGVTAPARSTPGCRGCPSRCPPRASACTDRRRSRPWSTSSPAKYSRGRRGCRSSSGAVDQRGRGGSRRAVRSRPGEAPYRSGVPDVLHGRAIVQRHSVGDRFAGHRLAGRETKLRVVDAEPVLFLRVGELHEGAEPRADFASQKQAELLWQLQVAVLHRGLSGGRIVAISETCLKRQESLPVSMISQ
jgi:hypothetical protein